MSRCSRTLGGANRLPRPRHVACTIFAFVSSLQVRTIRGRTWSRAPRRANARRALSLALGLSFAAAGFRTLLIDGDLSTRQLSLGLDAGDQPGVMEAVTGAEPAIRRIRSGLSILPAGNSRPQDACRLSPTGTARMLASLHDRFDVVLIDGDPILTGLTASVIAPQAGGVIVTMNRGQDQPLVQSAIRQLGMLGAELAGAVFNRAAAGDFPTNVKDQPGACRR